MTESAEDRSKRGFCKHLRDYEWLKQISIFYCNYDDALNAPEHGLRVRRALAKAFPDTTFLWRLVCKNVRESAGVVDATNQLYSGTIPYWTAFITSELKRKELLPIIEKNLKVSEDGFRLFVRSTPEWKLETYEAAVMKQKPHDLQRVFGQRKLNRFHLMNKGVDSLF